MKFSNLFLLLAVLFISDYALAQIPACPCDTAELPNGLSGNEIVDIVCPGGSLGDDSVFFVTPDLVNVTLDVPPHTQYFTAENNVGEKRCEINTDGPEPVALDLNDQEYRNCRERLIQGCSLEVRDIPALSVWGLIAFAGVLGMIGLYAVRRRKAAA
jgi:hypothetical protein